MEDQDNSLKDMLIHHHEHLSVVYNNIINSVFASFLLLVALNTILLLIVYNSIINYIGKLAIACVAG